jgi:DNA (cytosine-5)-methyltransferase 1
MPNILAWPNDAAVCSLSQVLEKGSIPRRYFLSSTACAGILRRAEKRGKKLPAPLQAALMAVASPALTKPVADICSPSIQCYGGGNTSGSIDVAACLTAKGQRIDFEVETFAVQPIAGTLDASYGRLQGCSGQDMNHGHSHLVPIAFDARQECVSSTEVFGALSSSSPQAQAIAFSCKDHGADAAIELAPTMRAMTHGASHANAGGQLAVCVTGTITHTLKAEGFDASEDGTGRGQPIVAHAIQAGALRTNPDSGPDGMGVQADVAYTLEARAEVQCAQIGMAVRRLTPRECERLQGFPDDYTLIPYGRAIKLEKLERDWIKYLLRGGVMTFDQVCRAAADGPRYKALGNSWAIPVVRWIGARINKAFLEAL